MRWLFSLVIFIFCGLVFGLRTTPVLAADSTQVKLHLAILPYGQCDSLVDRVIRQKAGCFPYDKYQSAVQPVVDPAALTLSAAQNTDQPPGRLASTRFSSHEIIITLHNSEPGVDYYFSHNSSNQKSLYTRPPPFHFLG